MSTPETAFLHKTSVEGELKGFCEILYIGGHMLLMISCKL